MGDDVQVREGRFRNRVSHLDLLLKGVAISFQPRGQPPTSFGVSSPLSAASVRATIGVSGAVIFLAVYISLLKSRHAFW